MLHQQSWSDAVDDEMVSEYLQQLKDDFNTANAYKVIFDTVKLLNGSLRVRDVDFESVSTYANSVVHMLSVLGIDFEYVTVTDDDVKTFELWNEAKINKDFDAADTYRDHLMEKGLI